MQATTTTKPRRRRPKLATCVFCGVRIPPSESHPAPFFETDESGRRRWYYRDACSSCSMDAKI